MEDFVIGKEYYVARNDTSMAIAFTAAFISWQCHHSGGVEHKDHNRYCVNVWANGIKMYGVASPQDLERISSWI